LVENNEEILKHPEIIRSGFLNLPIWMFKAVTAELEE
jgi:hypothetical protein